MRLTINEFRERYPHCFAPQRSTTPGWVRSVEFGANEEHILSRRVAANFVRAFPDLATGAESLHFIEPKVAQAQLNWALEGMAYGGPCPVTLRDIRPLEPTNDFFLLFEEPYFAYTSISPDHVSLSFDQQGKEIGSGYCASGFDLATFELLICVVDRDSIGLFLVGAED